MKTVLVIDDDPGMRNMLRIVLEMNGFKFYSAHDGTSALFLLKSMRFDIIISDFMIPGETGSELVRKARDHYPRSLIIGISANNVGNEFLDAGADAFLKKPFAAEKLISLITEDKE